MEEKPKRRAKDEVVRENQCEYVVPRKKRRCRMITKIGNKFCGEHSIFDPENSDRIVCPNDQNHTVLRSELDEHLKKCNNRLSKDPWIVENLNKVKKSGENEDFYRPTEEEVDEMILIVNKIYEEIKEEFGEIQKIDFNNEEMKKLAEEIKEKKKCHLVQLNSIISNLQAFMLLNNDPNETLIDLGSGKAQLIYWTAKEAPLTNYLLVDRMGSRNKFDRKALHEDPSLKIERLRCSIEHLDLNKVEMVQNSSSITAVCKHFCGAATDFGIRCLQNSIKNGLDLNGFALAPCCHHRCDYEEYVGQDFLKKNGISEEKTFSALRHISTWACCGFYQKSSEEGDKEELRPNKEKCELGRKAKRILEFGRKSFLETLGYDVRIISYVDYDVSPENLLLVGTKKEV